MSVVLELAAGLAIGNAGLAGFTRLDFLKTNAVVDLLSQIALVVLFFQVGLESTFADMKTVGGRAFLVAVCGIAGSVVCGWTVARALLPQASSSVHLFLAASLAATSVGVTARVLKDLGRARTATAHVILGAAVADDIVSLLVLAAIGVSGVMTFHLQPGAFAAIGAFAAGLLIDERRSHKIDMRIAPYARWIVPVFFI